MFSIELTILVLALVGVIVIIALQVLDRTKAKSGTEESNRVEDSLKKLNIQFTNSLQHQQQEQKNQSEALAKVYQSIGALDKLMSTDVAQLSTGVEKIQEIFHNVNKRGHYGEQQLQDIMESVLPADLFEMQHQLSNNTRVDCLVKFPDPPGPVGVDSKFPAKSYEDYLSAETDEEQKQASKTFKGQVSQQIKEIADKYIVPNETSEFALMFVPSESIFTEIHVNPEFSSLVDEARTKRVFVVSPNTLMAALNTVRSIVATMKVQREAKKVLEGLTAISADAKRLFDRASKFQKQEITAMKSLGEVLTSAKKVHEGIDKLQAGNVELLNGSGTDEPTGQQAIT